MGHRQKGKGMKRQRSWHHRGGGPDHAFARASKRLSEGDTSMPDIDLPEVTTESVTAELRRVADLFGWEVRNVRVAENGVAFQFWWTPADDVLPEGHIACSPVIKDDPIDWLGLHEGVMAAVGAMHAQYAIRRQIMQGSST